MNAILGMCTKNNENTIEKQLKIIISQKIKPDEVVIVDASDDSTPEIIKDILESAGITFKIIRQKGSGLGDARQEIFEYAKGKFDLIVFLDTEKYPINENWFGNHIKFHKEHEDSAVLNGRFVKKDYEPVSPFKDINYFIQCNCSIKIDYLELAGGYDRCLKRGEDWDLAIRLYKIGARSYVSSKVASYEVDTSDLKAYLKKKLQRPSSLNFVKKYGLWYIKNYPHHILADTLGTMNLISMTLSPLHPPFLVPYLLSLLIFNYGMYKLNKNIILNNKLLIFLLPIIYGMSFIKSLPQTIAKSNGRCKN